MLRGEIWWISFETSSNAENTKAQPAIIISNDIANRFLNRVQIIPLTNRQTDKLHPTEVLIMVENQPYKAMADQITTLDKGYLSNQIGKITSDEIIKLEKVLLLQLGLS